mmetsp:Transcript_67268/g.190867  ORF Transcript_67268/g.190867 Transcript_67268/m.190867 type:complete len:606 (-) Transcript_67268:148-1965(-)
MATSTRVVVLFLFLLAGAEAERINSAANLAAAARAEIESHSFKGRSSTDKKTMDLDWHGCASKTNWLFGPSCGDVEGCEWHKLWLDAPRQSCRFSDGYKLRPENVQRFLPVELARLEEKSATFAKSGCLFGGWFAKCYRRMRQIIRLLKYVRRAVSDAKSDPSHPAHALAASEETSQKLLRAADNLAAGFRKLQGTDGVGEAFGMMAEGPESLRAAAAAVEGAENRSLTDEEKVAMENTRAVEGMLKAAGTNLDDEQRAELYAQLEAGGPTEESEDDLDADVEELVGSLDQAMGESDSDDRSNLQQQEGSVDEEDEEDPEDVVAKAADAAALVQLGAQTGTNSTGALQARGTGPLKWIFQHGLGWIVTRIAWVLLFLVGSAIGLIRAGVIFPLLFLGCTLTKFITWVFRDVGYNLLWEGEIDLVAKRFLKIGKCPAWAWEAVGFDASSKDTVKQIVVQPATFASGVTGVHHWYKSEEGLCAKVKCGSHAACHRGDCICNKGYYPDASSPGHCVQGLTSAGCRCKAMWSQQELVIFSSRHYGCPSSGRCEVDRAHASFSTCRSNIVSAPKGILEHVGNAVGILDSAVFDTCRALLPFRGMVVPVAS